MQYDTGWLLFVVGFGSQGDMLNCAQAGVVSLGHLHSQAFAFFVQHLLIVKVHTCLLKFAAQNSFEVLLYSLQLSICMLHVL